MIQRKRMIRYQHVAHMVKCEILQGVDRKTRGGYATRNIFEMETVIEIDLTETTWQGAAILAQAHVRPCGYFVNASVPLVTSRFTSLFILSNHPILCSLELRAQ
jgi:hypothetical protein